MTCAHAVKKAAYLSTHALTLPAREHCVGLRTKAVDTGVRGGGVVVPLHEPLGVVGPVALDPVTDLQCGHV